MACPRCGCRMLSKAGSGSGSRLICSDCRLPLSSLQPAGDGRTNLASRGTQITTALLVLLFAITASVLMTLKDQGELPLLGSQELRLEGRQPDAMPLRRLARLRAQARGSND